MLTYGNDFGRLTLYAIQIKAFQGKSLKKNTSDSLRAYAKESDSPANLLNYRYFQRKHKENTKFPLIIRTFLLYLQRILIYNYKKHDNRTRKRAA